MSSTTHKRLLRSLVIASAWTGAFLSLAAFRGDIRHDSMKVVAGFVWIAALVGSLKWISPKPPPLSLRARVAVALIAVCGVGILLWTAYLDGMLGPHT